MPMIENYTQCKCSWQETKGPVITNCVLTAVFFVYFPIFLSFCQFREMKFDTKTVYNSWTSASTPIVLVALNRCINQSSRDDNVKWRAATRKLNIPSMLSVLRTARKKFDVYCNSCISCRHCWNPFWSQRTKKYYNLHERRHINKTKCPFNGP